MLGDSFNPRRLGNGGKADLSGPNLKEINTLPPARQDKPEGPRFLGSCCQSACNATQSAARDICNQAFVRGSVARRQEISTVKLQQIKHRLKSKRCLLSRWLLKGQTERDGRVEGLKWALKKSFPGTDLINMMSR